MRSKHSALSPRSGARMTGSPDPPEGAGARHSGSRQPSSVCVQPDESSVGSRSAMNGSRSPSFRAPQSMESSSRTVCPRLGARAVEGSARACSHFAGGRLRSTPLSGWSRRKNRSRRGRSTSTRLGLHRVRNGPSRDNFHTPGKNPLLLQHCIAVTCSTF